MGNRYKNQIDTNCGGIVSHSVVTCLFLFLLPDLATAADAVAADNGAADDLAILLQPTLFVFLLFVMALFLLLAIFLASNQLLVDLGVCVCVLLVVMTWWCRYGGDGGQGVGVQHEMVVAAA